MKRHQLLAIQELQAELIIQENNIKAISSTDLDSTRAKHRSLTDNIYMQRIVADLLSDAK